MLPIAKVIKSNGIDGGILIGMRGISIDEIDRQEPVFIEFDGLPVPFFFDDLTPKGKDKAIAHITGVSSLEDAEEIVGRLMSVEYFEEEDGGEDFSGWTLFDKDRPVGTVEGLEDIPGNPCLIVGEVLIPLHEDLILEIDEKKREITLDLPEGLI